MYLLFLLISAVLFLSCALRRTFFSFPRHDVVINVLHVERKTQAQAQCIHSCAGALRADSSAVPRQRRASLITRSAFRWAGGITGLRLSLWVHKSCAGADGLASTRVLRPREYTSPMLTSHALTVVRTCCVRIKILLLRVERKNLSVLRPASLTLRWAVPQTITLARESYRSHRAYRR